MRGQLAAIYAQTFPGREESADPLRDLQAAVRETRDLADHLGVSGPARGPLEVLREISSRLPADLDVSFTELRIELRTVQARGHAKDFESVGRVKTELSKSPWLDDVQVSNVVNDRTRGGKRFSLGLHLGGGA